MADKALPSGASQVAVAAAHRVATHRPPPGVRTDLAVPAELASQLGSGGWFRLELRAVFGELRHATAGGTVDYAGVTWERVNAEDGVFWPCPSVDWSGMSRLFVECLPASGDG